MLDAGAKVEELCSDGTAQPTRSFDFSRCLYISSVALGKYSWF